MAAGACGMDARGVGRQVNMDEPALDGRLRHLAPFRHTHPLDLPVDQDWPFRSSGVHGLEHFPGWPLERPEHVLQFCL